MTYTICHTPKSDMETKTGGIETIEQEIYDSKKETGDDQPLELFPNESEETLPTCLFHTLIAKNIAPYKSNSFDAEAADKMPQPPIDSIVGHPCGRHPAPCEYTQRMVHNQEEDDKGSDDGNLV